MQFKLIFSALLALLSINSLFASSDTTKTEKYKNSRLKSQKFYVGGNLVKEVKYKYRKKGYSVITVENPKAGIKRLNVYRNSGELWHEVSLIGTKPEGVSKSYYENGQVCCLQLFKAGKRDSIATVFHDNGQIFETALYKNGRLMQILEKYDRMGHRLEKGNLVNGFGMANMYDETGRLIAIEHYQKGKRRSRQKR